jgi:hypothetical protein
MKLKLTFSLLLSLSLISLEIRADGPAGIKPPPSENSANTTVQSEVSLLEKMKALLGNG